MNASKKPGGVRAVFAGLRAAAQWRLLLLWTVSLLLPTALVALPVWRGLAAQFDHSVNADAIAAQLQLAPMVEAMSPLTQYSSPLFGGIGLGATLVALLLAPWLNGMTLASIRAGRRLGFAELLQGGLGEYWRMLRMTLWALLPLGLAFAIGSGAIALAEKTTEGAVLEAAVDNANRIAFVVMTVLLVLAHAGVEAGRGVLAAEPALRSVLRAWWRGTKLLLRRPLATLAVYLGTALVGYGLALVLGALRTQVNAAGWLGFIGAFVITQLLVACIACGRNARLYAMADLARHEQLRRDARHVHAAANARHVHAAHSPDLANAAAG
jgi:hypothetical protein